MSNYENIFNWIQFQEGRAKFNGGIRGWDERRHETYALEIEGKIRYGEISKIYLSNNNDYNVEVVSFGYAIEGSVGIPNEPGVQGLLARGAYTQEQLKAAKSLVSQLIVAGVHFEDRPSVLRESPHSHFMGEIVFCEGWANVRPEPRT